MIKQCQQEKIVDLWNKYQPLVLGFFINRTRNKVESEDLTAETFTRLFVHLAKEENKSKVKNPQAYIFKIAHNVLTDSYAKKSHTLYFAQDLDQNQKILDIQTENSDNLNKLQEVIRCVRKQVTGEQFEILNQIYVDKIKSHALAQEYNISSESLRKRNSRNLEKIRKACINLFNSIFTKKP
jgi:RNA polymerase sigma factor (sigma-70 family)